MSLLKLVTALKGGSGSGNFGHAGRPGKRGGSAGRSAGFSIADVNKSAEQLMAKGYIPVFRGTGADGVKQVRPSSEGVLGPGVYFYDTPMQARSYAELGGGIVTGFVHKNDVKIQENLGSMFSPAHKVIVLPDATKFIKRGTIDTEDTLDRSTIERLVPGKLDER